MDRTIVDERTRNGAHAVGIDALPPMLTAVQVAELLQIRRTQVYALARSGVIPAVRVGGLVRFNRDRLRAWMDAGGTGLDEAQ